MRVSCCCCFYPKKVSSSEEDGGKGVHHTALTELPHTGSTQTTIPLTDLPAHPAQAELHQRKTARPPEPASSQAEHSELEDGRRNVQLPRLQTGSTNKEDANSESSASADGTPQPSPRTGKGTQSPGDHLADSFVFVGDEAPPTELP